ncbi:MAG: LysR family transcriptional regulator [Janthinobacterium lividum]
MELRWLHDFLAVVETRNFTKAAELRHTSQASLSRRIQQLETWIGVRLIDRAVYPSCLTAHGERFVAQAAEMLRLADESRSGQTKTNDFLRIALPLTVAIHLLPPWWRSWFAKSAAPNCEAIPSNLHDAVTALVSDSADLLLCYYSPLLPMQLEPDRFECKLLMRDILRPYAAPSLLRKLLTPADTALRTHCADLLLYADGTYLGQLVRRIFETQDLPPTAPKVFRSDMADVLCGMAIQGLGVAWLPGCSAHKAVSRGELMPFGSDRWSLELSYVAYRTSTNRNPALVTVWNAMPTLASHTKFFLDALRE